MATQTAPTLRQQEYLDAIRANPGLSQNELAAQVGVHHHNVGKFLVRMVRDGLVRIDTIEIGPHSRVYRIYPAKEV